MTRRRKRKATSEDIRAPGKVELTDRGTALPLGYTPVVSGELNYLMRRMMAQGPDSIDAVETEWPAATLRGESVQAEVVFTAYAQSPRALVPDEQVAIYQERMWNLVRSMDDLTADVWDAIVSQWVSEARTPEAKIWVSVDRILSYRGLSSYSTDGRRGGFTAAQRQAITECLLRIMAMRVQVFSMTVLEEHDLGDGQRRFQPVKRQIGGPALEVGLDLMQTDFLGSREIKALYVRPGDMFARYYMGAGRPVALLSRKALTYRPQREGWEKRLTRYFAYDWDRRSQECLTRQQHTVVQLLDAAHHEPNPRRPDATKERLEKALERLAEDGVIAGWRYMPETWDEEARPVRGWLSVWRQASVEITAPEEVTRFYSLSLPDVSSAVALVPALPLQVAEGVLTGEAIEALRKHWGLTQTAFAEQLGVTRALIALVETGRRGVSARLQGAVKEWLARQET